MCCFFFSFLILREQVETCSDVLGRLLAALPAAVNIQLYPTELDRALNHPTEAVKLLVLKQVGRILIFHDLIELPTFTFFKIPI